MPLTQVAPDMLNSAVLYTGFKNRLINGAMNIDQRNNGSAQNTLAAGYVYTLDRWSVYSALSGRFSSQRNRSAVTRPAGFQSYLGLVVSTAYSPGSTDYNFLSQPIEAFNAADFNFGTANAVTLTLSFLVYTSIAGTHSGFLSNSGFTLTYPFTFSVPVANTWTRVAVTIPGATTGSWPSPSIFTGLVVGFNLGNGSSLRTSSPNAWTNGAVQPSSAVSVVSTSGATFYITGVQLEKADVATNFDYRPYGTELMLCQRYCRAYSSYAMGRARDNDTVFGPGIIFGTTMRTTPTLRSGASFIVGGGTAGTPIIISNTGYASSPDVVLVAGSGSVWSSQVQVAFTGIFEAEL